MRGTKARVVQFPGIGHAPWLRSANQIDVVREFLLAKTARAARQVQVGPYAQAA